MHRVLKRHESLMNSYAQRRWDHSVQHVFDLIQLYRKNRLDVLLTGNSDTLYRNIKKTHTHACEIRENYSILSHGERRFELIRSDEPANSNNSATYNSSKSHSITKLDIDARQIDCNGN